MKIGFNKYFEIDSNKRKAYNYKLYAFKNSNADSVCFSSNGIKLSMDKKELDKLKISKFLANSMVDFIPNIVSDYFENKLSKNEFAILYISKLNKVKFYLSQMKPELRKENLTVYKNEFTLADSINKFAIKINEQDDSSFNNNLKQVITDYNKINQEDN